MIKVERSWRHILSVRQTDRRVNWPQNKRRQKQLWISKLHLDAVVLMPFNLPTAGQNCIHLARALHSRCIWYMFKTCIHCLLTKVDWMETFTWEPIQMITMISLCVILLHFFHTLHHMCWNKVILMRLY